MKLSKSDLKAIVKECLVEILNEGLGGISSAPVAPFPRQQRPVASSLSDNLKRQSPTPQLREAIKRESGGDKVLESILADTAASTLPKFLQNDGRTPPMPASGGLAESVVAAASPDELFGDAAASKWAALAFMDSPIKK